ncbi:glycosyltransferase family 4 protein [Magnetospirillum sp. 15-1]|uniref:MraY family glycosyltransferase n=1 Tax=Magnetospirillum sp. 15-1 TaxID=1979370 RepID=UPI000BBC6356|nr:glycosyltransferase family 4 protein [Magnetospirillum sp. 15-1]
MTAFATDAVAAWAGAWPPGLVALGLAVLLTRQVIPYLLRRQMLDRPNERSSHTRPTPRGGGLAVAPAALLGWALALAASPPGELRPALIAMALGGVALMLLGWADDRHSLPAGPRFAAHGLAVAVAMALLPGDALVFGGLLPGWADRLVTGLGWLWFANLYNFMDGIDGISGVETACLGLGAALVATLAGAFGLIPFGLALAGAGAGFLVWNWHPAKIFLGDVGSVPLGFLAGGLLIALALSGQLAAALILPAYYLADATITLTRRALAGEKVWQAHRKHFYQRAVQGGRSHAQVSLAVLAAGLALTGAALLAAAGRMGPGLALAGLVTIAILGLFAHWAKGKSP